MSSLIVCVCLSVTLTPYYSLLWNTVSEINQMKKKIIIVTDVKINQYVQIGLGYTTLLR